VGFKKEQFKDWEKKSLKERYSLKGAWRALGLFAILCIIGPFVFPLIPPRYNYNWTFPANQQEYYSRINFIWLPSLVVFVFVFIGLRFAIDIGLGYKKTADFEVTSILIIGPIKLLTLDGWRIFYIKKREAYFDKVRQGQRLQIKRTATHQLIDYYVYEKNASA